jgi:hypothetical protein
MIAKDWHMTSPTCKAFLSAGTDTVILLAGLGGAQAQQGFALSQALPTLSMAPEGSTVAAAALPGAAAQPAAAQPGGSGYDGLWQQLQQQHMWELEASKGPGPGGVSPGDGPPAGTPLQQPAPQQQQQQSVSDFWRQLQGRM